MAETDPETTAARHVISMRLLRTAKDRLRLFLAEIEKNAPNKECILKAWEDILVLYNEAKRRTMEKADGPTHG